MFILRRHLGRLIALNASRSPLWRYGISTGVSLVAFVLTWTTVSFSTAPFLTIFLIAVLFASVFGGRNSGLAATAISTVINLFALPPRWSPLVSDPESVVRLIVFLIAGSVVSVFIGMIGDLQSILDIERERLATTLASIGDGVIATDTGGRVTFINSAAENVTGWKSRDAIGTPLHKVFQIIDSRTREPVADPVEKAFKSGRAVGLGIDRILLRRDSEEIPINETVAPIRDFRGKTVGAVLVFRDVTLERQAQAALLRAEKLESVGRMASTIAHEINNPLTAITNLLYLIESASDIGPASRSLAQLAQRELNRASHVAKRTLSFSRHTNIRGPLLLSDLIDEVLALYVNSIDRLGIRLLKEYRTEALVVADSNEAKQVIAHLISNALDACTKNGRLRVKTVVSTWSGVSRVRVTIADTGIGIAKEHMSKIFEPFFSTKTVAGTGLGLWMTKRIVDNCDGCVHVRSTVGKGTVVIVCWPVAQASAVSDSAAP